MAAVRWREYPGGGPGGRADDPGHLVTLSPGHLVVCQPGGQEVVECLEGLDDHAGVGDGGHEVGVALPAGDDVPVEVAGQAGAGGAAEVQADVVAVGAHQAV